MGWQPRGGQAPAPTLPPTAEPTPPGVPPSGEVAGTRGICLCPPTVAKVPGGFAEATLQPLLMHSSPESQAR